MDHLPHPRSPLKTQTMVLYHVKEEHLYQVNDNFAQFAEKHGWNLQTLANLEFEEQLADSAASIIQSWLFFGVLRSVIDVPFDPVAFVSLDSNNCQVISTSCLPALVAAWRDSKYPNEAEVATLSPAQKAEKFNVLLNEAKHINNVLEMANMMLVSLSFAAVRKALVPQTLLLSIEILLSGLSNTAILIYGLDHIASVGSAAEIDFKQLNMFDDWCPHMFRRLKCVLNNSALFFLGRMANCEPKQLHTDCMQRDSCQSERVDSSRYQPAHVCADGKCDMIGPELSHVERILDNNDYPIITLSRKRDGDFEIDVAPGTGSSSYIVISHVWAHGLGNPVENKMPTCQIERLYDLIGNCLSGTCVRLWIDTLLCPVSGRFCDLAIGKMVPTYRDAQAVLVLDEGLLQVSRELSPVELLAQVATSMWMRRLWTLQEGALNLKVLLQFADGPRDYDDILRAVGDGFIRQSSHETVSRELLNACQTFRLIGIPAGPGRNLNFGMWLNVLQYRKTSELRDESLCLATLLGHDLTTIVGLTPEKRLQKVYEAQCIFPYNLIFLSHPRMTQDSLKWAPQTYLESGGGFGGTIVSPPNHFRACYIPEQGLVLDVPTFRFHAESRITVPMMFQDPRTRIVFILLSASLGTRAEYTPTSLPTWSGDFCILFETRRENNNGRTVVAVLAACAELVTPTPSMISRLTNLDDSSRSFTRVHYMQQVIVGLEARSAEALTTDDVCDVVRTTMSRERVCIA